MKKAKQLFLICYPTFHRFTIIFTVFFLLWQIYWIEPLHPSISRVAEVIAPNLLEFLSGGNALQPTDFVNNKTN